MIIINLISSFQVLTTPLLPLPSARNEILEINLRVFVVVATLASTIVSAQRGHNCTTVIGGALAVPLFRN